MFELVEISTLIPDALLRSESSPSLLSVDLNDKGTIDGFFNYNKSFMEVTYNTSSLSLTCPGYCSTNKSVVSIKDGLTYGGLTISLSCRSGEEMVGRWFYGPFSADVACQFG